MIKGFKLNHFYLSLCGSRVFSCVRWGEGVSWRLGLQRAENRLKHRSLPSILRQEPSSFVPWGDFSYIHLPLPPRSARVTVLCCALRISMGSEKSNSDACGKDVFSWEYKWKTGLWLPPCPLFISEVSLRGPTLL